MSGPDERICGNVVIASGGSGGHVFPAQALAETLQARGCTILLITDQRGLTRKDALFRADTKVVQAGGLAGAAWPQRLQSSMHLIRGTMQATWFLRKLKKAIGVGFGGYASIPGALATLGRRWPLIVHEQNSVCGRVNRFFTPHAHALATSFPATLAVPPRHQGKIRHTGNPVRAEISALQEKPYIVPQSPSPLHVLVIGGSQGARELDRRVPEAMGLLPLEIRSRIHIVHQSSFSSRRAHIESQYRTHNVPTCEVRSFFPDMAQRLSWAHLVIARAGASTISELAVSCRPSLLVPLAHAADDHQTINARRLCDVGGGWLIPSREGMSAAIAARLRFLAAHPHTLHRSGVAAGKLACFDSTEQLANLVCRTGLARGVLRRKRRDT